MSTQTQDAKVARARKLLACGEPAPWFAAHCTSNPRFHFDTVAGRYVVLCFLGSAMWERSRRILGEFLSHHAIFNDETVCFFGVSTDPADESDGRLREILPGIRYFWDYDGEISRLYGAAPYDPPVLEAQFYRCVTYVLDERLRVVATVSFDDTDSHVASVLASLQALPALPPSTPASVSAPVLIVPRVFEPELCQELIRYHEQTGGAESGFMRDVDGRTVEVHDFNHKRRRDREISDPELRDAALHRIHDRLVPEIAKAFQFRATRIERHLVACYRASEAGHFRPHRDNTTKGTAHRRFAVSLNLNAGEYDGGHLRFPEFGRQTYCPPTGGAVVFSCGLLHEATPVTRGQRYAYLPFLYDEAAAEIRQQNLRFLDAAS